MEKLNDVQRKLVEDNLKLIFYTLGLCNVRRDSDLYEDLVSACMLWLCDAAFTFKKEFNVRFSTFAVAFLKRKIYWYHGGSGKSIRTDLSIYGEDYRLCSEKDEICDSEDTLLAAQIKGFMKKGLTDTENIILEGYLNGEKTSAISKKLDMSAEKVRNEKLKAISKIKEFLSEEGKK